MIFAVANWILNILYKARNLLLLAEWMESPQVFSMIHSTQSIESIVRIV